MSRNRRPTKNVVSTYTLTLITTVGEQTPIGPGGTPTFHRFHDWTEASGAMADVVATIGLHHVHAIATTTTQTRDGKLDQFSASHFDANEVAEICAAFAIVKAGIVNAG